MKPIEFEYSNKVIGGNEDGFQALPICHFPDGEVMSCWELTDEDIAKISKSKRIYISQLTNNKVYQPTLPKTDITDGIELTDGSGFKF